MTSRKEMHFEINKFSYKSFVSGIAGFFWPSIQIVAI